MDIPDNDTNVNKKKRVKMSLYCSKKVLHTQFDSVIKVAGEGALSD